LDELCGEVEKYPQVLLNVQLAERRDLLGLPAIQGAVAGAEQELNGRGRVLLRASGTEPLLRVMVEGQDAALVQALAEQLAQVVREHAGARP
jgi:phosphoglucosamine mutase